MKKNISIWIAGIGGLALLAAVVITGCTKSGKLDTDALGNAVGGSNGNLIKAGGHEMNALALDEKAEDAIGQSVGAVVTNRYGVYHNQAVLTYVSLVGLTVANSTPNPGGNWVFGVLDTDEVNAFSGPNGYVFVTRGLLAHLQDEAELAGVLGHEMAHCCHHDGLNQVKMAEHQAAFSNAVAAADKNGQFGALADAGVDAITKTGYTQPQEFNADQDGVKYMKAAGYDPRSYLAFLVRMEQLEAGHSGTVMSTHPGVPSRVKKVGAEIAQLNLAGGATLADRFSRNMAAMR